MTTHHRRLKTHTALPLPDWPEADHETWLAAQAPANALCDGGVVSHLSRRTLRDLTQGYGYFLRFLAHQGRFLQDAPAAASVSEENVLDYIGHLETRVSSVTLANYLWQIARVATCLDPGRDWGWLQRIVRRLDLRAKPRDRRKDVVEIKALFQLGLQLMDRADKVEIPMSFTRIAMYRDGLIIALLAANPIRLANITALEIGKTLVKDGTTWSINIPAEATKERRPHVAVLPDWCSARIDRYMDFYRPCFRNAASTSRLWLSQRGLPLSEISLYRSVVKRTRHAFGRSISPHLFRSCLATSTAVHHGAQIGLATTVLHHQNPKVTERHYNRARMIDAVRSYQDVLLAVPEAQEEGA